MYVGSRASYHLRAKYKSGVRLGAIAITYKPNIDKELAFTQGIGAMSAVTAHTVMQAPKPALHARMAGGAATAATVPKTQPAAA